MSTIIKSNMEAGNIHLPKDNELPLSFEFTKSGDVILALKLKVVEGGIKVRTTNADDGVVIYGTTYKDGMSFGAPEHQYGDNKRVVFKNVKVGEKRTVFLNCLDRLEKIQINGNSSNADYNCVFNMPIIKYLALCPNLIFLGFGQPSHIDTEKVDMYNLPLLSKLEGLELFSSGGLIYPPAYLFYNKNMKSIRMAKIGGIDLSYLYKNSPNLESIDIQSMGNCIDNDISFLTDTNCNTLIIRSGSTLFVSYYWGGGRNLMFKNALNNISVEQMSSNEDYADILCVLSKSSFNEGATVTIKSMTINEKDEELVNAINTLKGKCTLSINGQIVA